MSRQYSCKAGCCVHTAWLIVRANPLSLTYPNPKAGVATADFGEVWWWPVEEMLQIKSLMYENAALLYFSEKSEVVDQKNVLKFDDLRWMTLQILWNNSHKVSCEQMLNWAELSGAIVVNFQTEWVNPLSTISLNSDERLVHLIRTPQLFCNSSA